MSGAGSRGRRVAAVRRARADVYASHGMPMAANPFADERQARIYERAYTQWRGMYQQLEARSADIAAAYGWRRAGHDWERIA